MAKISDIYGIVRESRERIIKTMQERGITELATILPYSEWCKQEECEPEEAEDDDTNYMDYKDQEAPYVVFIGKYNMDDYRIDKVTLVGDRFKFEGHSNELGYDWAWEDDTVWATRMFVWEKLEELLGIGDEPEKVWIVKQESNDDGEMHFFTQPCKDEATAKSVLQEWKEALLTKHPKYCDAKPYIDGEKDPDDQVCCYEWEDHDAGFYIKVLGDDYYETITIEEEKIR